MSEPAIPVLDVRPDLAAGEEPFDRIMRTARETPAGASFTVIAPFQPVPLLSLLAGQGFSYSSDDLGNGSFRVTFTRQTGR